MMAFAYSRPPPVPQMPSGLRELMEDLTRQVLLQSPSDVHAFCASHMRKLLDIRDGPPKTRTLTLEEKIRRAQKIVKQRAKQRIKQLDGNKLDSIEKSEDEKQVEDASSESIQASVKTERQLKYQLELELFPEDTKIFEQPIIFNHMELIEDKDNLGSKANYPDELKESNVFDQASEQKTQEKSLLQDVKNPEVMEEILKHNECERQKAAIFETNHVPAQKPHAVTEHNKEQKTETELQVDENKSSIFEDEKKLTQDESVDNNDSKNDSNVGMNNNENYEDSIETKTNIISNAEPLFEIEIENQTNNDTNSQINLVDKHNKIDDMKDTEKTDMKDIENTDIKNNEYIEKRIQNVGEDQAEQGLFEKEENDNSKSIETEINIIKNEQKKETEKEIQVINITESYELTVNDPTEQSQEEKRGDIDVIRVDPELSTISKIETVKALLNGASENADNDLSSDTLQSNMLPSSERNEKVIPVTIFLESDVNKDQGTAENIAKDIESDIDQKSVRDKVEIEENKSKSVNEINIDVIQVDPELSTSSKIETVEPLLNNAFENTDNALSFDTLQSNAFPSFEQNEKVMPVKIFLESDVTKVQASTENIVKDIESDIDQKSVKRKDEIEENVSKSVNEINAMFSAQHQNHDMLSENNLDQTHQITNKDFENPVDDIVNKNSELVLPISQTSEKHSIDILDEIVDKSEINEDCLVSSGLFQHQNESISESNTDEAAHTEETGVDVDHMTHEYETLNIDQAPMDLETAAVTIQKVFRSFLFKSRNSTFDDAASDESTTLDKDIIREGDSEYTTIHEISKDRRTLGLSRMDTVLQTVNEEKSLSLSTDDSSTLSSAATTIQAHVRGFLVRNKLDSNKTASTNSLGNSNPDSTDDQPKNKTVLNIHIVPEGGQFVSRDDSLLASMDMSVYGSPYTSTDLHPLGHDLSERRKQLKREDAIQSVSPPSNNSGKLSEDIDSVKDMAIVNSEVIKQQSTDDTLVNKTEDLKQNIESQETTPTQSVTEDTVKTAIEMKRESSESKNDAPSKAHLDEMDVVTPFNDNDSTDTADSRLLHSGEFHDAVLPTKVSRKDTSVIRGE